MGENRKYNYEYFKNAFQKIKEEFSGKNGLEERFDQLCNLFSNMMDRLRERMDKVSSSIEKFTQEIRENANPMYQTMKDVNNEIAKTVAEMADSPDYSIKQVMAALDRAEKNIMSWDNDIQRRELMADFIYTFSQNTKSLEGYLLAEDLIKKFREMEKDLGHRRDSPHSPDQKDFSKKNTNQRAEPKSENTETKKSFTENSGKEKQATDNTERKSAEKAKKTQIQENIKKDSAKKATGKHGDRPYEEAKNMNRQTVLNRSQDNQKQTINKAKDDSPLKEKNSSLRKSSIETKSKTQELVNTASQQKELNLDQRSEEAIELPFEDYENPSIEKSLEALYNENSRDGAELHIKGTDNKDQNSLFQKAEEHDEATELPFELYDTPSVAQPLEDFMPKEFNSDFDKTARALADNFDSGPNGGVAFLEWCIGKNIEEIQKMANRVDDNIQSPAGARDLFDAISEGKLDVHIKSEVDFEFER